MTSKGIQNAFADISFFFNSTNQSRMFSCKYHLNIV